MSTETTTTATDTGTVETATEATSTTTTTTTTTANTTNNASNKPSMKKVRSKKDLNDPSRFEGAGINFNGKLIGIENVDSARGDQMCQQSMQRLKIAVRASGQHKQKIIINVSLEGIKVIDLKSQAVNHTHAVHKISFISRDVTDSRAFGYVYGTGDGKHQFFAIKTEKAAEALVLTLRDLFQAVYEMKKKEMEDAKKKQEEDEVAKKNEENKAQEGEGQEGEHIYQVPKNGAPVEEGQQSPEHVYSVPNNNEPVKPAEEPSNMNDLLSLESELETIGKGIEQMNTLESLFTAAPLSAPVQGGMWGQPQAPAGQGAMFSIGGSPFGGPYQQQQPGVMPGAHPMPGTAAVNPFQPFPNVPPRTGIPGQPQPGFPAPGFPGTPHPSAATQPAFPTNFPPAPGVTVKPPAGQQTVGLPVTQDPFGQDPFTVGVQGTQVAGTDPFGNSPFGEDLLEPSKPPSTEEPVVQESKPKDAFSMLVDIGGISDPKKDPKALFMEKNTPVKKSLNELKVESQPPAKPRSPVGFQASDPFGGIKSDSLPPAADFSDPFGSKSADPFDTSFAQLNASQSNSGSPFSTTANSNAPTQQVASKESSPAPPTEGFDDDFNLPSPQGPPPPLPSDSTVSDNVICKPPSPPPRPNVDLSKASMNTSSVSDTPPIPPRPGSSHSRSDSVSSSSSQKYSPTPPQRNSTNSPQLPLRPNNQPNPSSSVPRPKPRTNIHSNPLLKEAHIDNEEASSSKSASLSVNVDKNKASSTEADNISTSTGGSVSDPFVSTDPFASTDPFTSHDPFADDPFASDPFSSASSTLCTFTSDTSDPFSASQPQRSNGTVHKDTNDDPFAVFDNTFANEQFSFDKFFSHSGSKNSHSGSKNKVKLKTTVAQ